MRVASMVFVNDLLQRTGIPIEFMRWNNGVPDDYYFTWEYFESPSDTLEENGYQENTVILRGYTEKEWLLLEQAKETIEKACGRTAILQDGTGVAVSYDTAKGVPTGDMRLKSIKINLIVQEWKVN